MSRAWIPVPGVPPLLSATVPLLYERDRGGDVRQEFLVSGARIAAVDLGAVDSRSDIFDQLRSVMVMPEWCGSGWDSIDDAFEEIRSGSSFPCVVLVEGLQGLLSRAIHLALEFVVRTSELQNAFAMAGDQLVFAYQVDSPD